MAVLRIAAFEKLAACIRAYIPELSTAVCPGPAAPSHRLHFPSLAISPLRFRYQPEQAKEWKHLNFATTVFEVGKHEAQIELRLGAKNHYQRAAIEEKLIHFFLRTPGSPGVVVHRIHDCFDALVAWELEDEEWEPEKIFDEKWYSILTITGQIPALVCRDDAYTINELQLGLTQDLSTAFTNLTISTSSSVELVEIGEDGTVTPI